LDDEPTQLHCNNENKIKFMTNLVFHAWTEHIEIQHHYIIKKVHVREIEIIYTPTTQQQDDVFTKSLGIIKFKKLQTNIHMLDFRANLLT
jgi:hypothetical protein